MFQCYRTGSARHTQRAHNEHYLRMYDHVRLFDWQHVCLNSVRPLPCLVGGALPGGLNICIDHWLAILTFKSVSVCPWLHDACMLAVLDCHWLQVIDQCDPSVTSVTLSVPSIDSMTKWPLLGEPPSFKTSLKWRVYTMHSSLIYCKHCYKILITT